MVHIHGRFMIDSVSRKGLNNYSHPRTDIAVITAVVDDERDKILLGRSVSIFPRNSNLC